MSTRRILESTHARASRELGYIALTLASGRGLSASRLRIAVGALREAADMLERIYSNEDEGSQRSRGGAASGSRVYRG